MDYTNQNDVTEALQNMVDQLQNVEDAKQKQTVISSTAAELAHRSLAERLSTMLDFERKYLELIKEFKDELKFAEGLQEDIRKERAKFFSETIGDVHETLVKSEINKEQADLWMTELVTSFTNSLDVSSKLAKDNVLATLGEIRMKHEESQQDLAK